MIDLAYWGSLANDVLQFFTSNLKPNLHLEIGVFTGNTIASVYKNCKRIHAVDINPDCLEHLRDFENVEFFPLCSDDYFAQLPNDIIFDTAFIDGDHSFEAVKRDFDNTFKRLSVNGLIFLHDTCPLDDSFKVPEHCGTAWKFADKCINSPIDYEMLTLPYHPGLTIVRKVK
jgi:predicted O-methyltransferase YrrM